jgi:HlyD family secretion protein
MSFQTINPPGKPVWKSVRWLIAAGGVIILSGGLAIYLTGSSSPIASLNSATPTPSYQTAVAKRGDLTISASGQGTLIAGKYVDLSFLSDGVVESLMVKAGDVVQAGQQLAQLDNINSLEAQVASDQLALLQAKKSLDDLQNNKDVSLAQAYQDMITAEQKYNDALRMTQRDLYPRCSKEVNTKNFQTLTNAKNKLALINRRYYGSEAWIEAKNVYDQALANYNYCISYTPDEKANYQSSLDVAMVTWQQAQSNYKALETASGIDPDQLALAKAQVNQASANLEVAQAELKNSNLTAPIAGTVTYLAANEGAMMKASTKYITISDLSQSMVDISVDETDLSKLKIDGLCQVVFDALPDVTFTGKIVQIDPELTQSGQIQVATARVKLDDQASDTLKSLPLGVKASVIVIEKQVKNALLVPISAVRQISAGQYGVFVVNSSGQLRLQVVKVGMMDTSRAEIISGLKEGDVVSTGLSSSQG